MLSVAYPLTEVPAEGHASLHTKNRKSLFVFSSAAVCCVQCFEICLPLRQSWLRLPHQQAALPTVFSRLYQIFPLSSLCLIFLFFPSSQCSFFPYPKFVFVAVLCTVGDATRSFICAHTEF